MASSTENDLIKHSELGKKSAYIAEYCPDLLFAIPRQVKRDEIHLSSDALPFVGFDLWTHYEVSWLNEKGKPIVAIAVICYDCVSPNIIESKSMKLYFNSFNNTKFRDTSIVQETIKKDLTAKVGAPVEVTLQQLTMLNLNKNIDLTTCFAGESLDELDIECNVYQVKPDFLKIESDAIVTEVLTSDLLKSNCLVTHQPDWGSVQIAYTGKKINRAGLLRYLVSFRNHNEFHEQCIERIFMDIMQRCQPLELTVYGRYTRRGGLDINPYRSTKKTENDANKMMRLIRQ